MHACHVRSLKTQLERKQAEMEDVVRRLAAGQGQQGQDGGGGEAVACAVVCAPIASVGPDAQRNKVELHVTCARDPLRT